MKLQLITKDNLSTFLANIKNIFATKEEVNNKVDVVEGKGLSTNDFTDDYKKVCEYAKIVDMEGVLTLALRGPDGKLYRLKLNENMDLVLDELI